MTPQVVELKGMKAYQAFCVFHKMMFGLKMIPEYITESYEDFFARVDTLPEESKLKMIQKAAVFVNLDEEELEALVCLAKDPNGVPYGPTNLKSLTPDQYISIIVAVCFEISKIKIDFLTSAEKKN
ncbi:hypothetical protein MAC3UK_0024 [Bdellovibrio phage MAC3UK]|nr:hypothetical protein MAC3UK_0024 [Bdellovibrio phage MAC3UK]